MCRGLDFFFEKFGIQVLETSLTWTLSESENTKAVFLFVLKALSGSTWAKLSLYSEALVSLFVVDYRFHIKDKILPPNKNLSDVTQYDIWKNWNTFNYLNKLHAFKYVGHAVLVSFYLVVLYTCLFYTFCYSIYCVLDKLWLTYDSHDFAYVMT